MKRLFTILLAVMMLLSLAACTGKPEPVAEATPEPTLSPTPAPTQAPKHLYIDPEEAASMEQTYISDREVYYEEADDRYLVMFGFALEDGTYFATEGSAYITITDNEDYVLYDAALRFSESDFRDWSFGGRDDERYLCGLYIYRSELEGSASSTGVLTLSAAYSGDSGGFPQQNLTITNLPDLVMNVVIPELPVTCKDESYFGNGQVIQIESLDYETTVSYDGTAWVTFSVLAKVVSKDKNQNESDTVKFGYKLYDSDGVVVDSDTKYCNAASVGEKVKDSFTIYHLNPRETYTLVILDIT